MHSAFNYYALTRPVNGITMGLFHIRRGKFFCSIGMIRGDGFGKNYPHRRDVIIRYCPSKAYYVFRQSTYCVWWAVIGESWNENIQSFTVSIGWSTYAGITIVPRPKSLDCEFQTWTSSPASCRYSDAPGTLQRANTSCGSIILEWTSKAEHMKIWRKTQSSKITSLSTAFPTLSLHSDHCDFRFGIFTSMHVHIIIHTPQV